MMMLKTICEVNKADSHATVYWSSKRQGYNVLKVQVPRSLEERREAAELIAIRYLLMEKKIFGVLPESSQSFELFVSCGAIKRLANRRPVSDHLRRYGGFLLGCLDGVSIEVRHHWIGNDDLCVENAESVESIRPNLKKYSTRHAPINTPVLGELYITSHAARRYKERSPELRADTNLSRAWSRLAKRVQHKRLEKVHLSDKVMAHKMGRYASVGVGSIWSVPSSDCFFVVVQDKDDNNLLATVYYRSSNVDRKDYGVKTGKEVFAHTGMPVDD